jgi:predicted DsbA family dithiol-disulfide isomerase
VFPVSTDGFFIQELCINLLNVLVQIASKVGLEEKKTCVLVAVPTIQPDASLLN